MCDSLCVRGDTVVLPGCEMNELGPETAENSLDLSESRVWSAVLNEKR
jgi:hypothetical protein